MARQGQSVRGLANALGISDTSARSRYAGRVEYGVNELHTVAQWLGVSASDFFHAPKDLVTAAV